MGDNNILEGVFAVCKPPSLSSAQVLRDLQNRFSTSKTFAPLLRETQERKRETERYQNKRRRRDDNDQFFKIGHGGTLDPLATGVLIVGIGRGTKTLSNFLGCTKQYDTVVLFGKSTDTYDICGKIVGERPFDQITKKKVEESLSPFRGNIKQVPPVYSALKINGVKAYEYARSGKELPRELESRDMVVDECTLVEYYDGGHHEFRWPIEEAPADEKAAVQKLMQKGQSSMGSGDKGSGTDQARVGSIPGSPNPATPQKDGSSVEQQTEEAETTQRAPTPPSENPIRERDNLDPVTKAALHTHNIPTLASEPAPSPAARVRLQVSSGFYVRSFAHDLGLSLSSYGAMAELTRTRQQNYTTISPAPPGQTTVLTYADLEAGEEVWGPKIKEMLERWMEANPVSKESDRADDRDKAERSHNYKGSGGGNSRNRWEKRGMQNQTSKERVRDKHEQKTERRRNSSSPE